MRLVGPLAALALLLALLPADAQIKPGPTIQTALDFAASLGGGEVYVPADHLPYDITTPLKISSNTHLKCEPGATINAVGALWTGTVATWSGIVPKAAIINSNQDAGSISDQNITIEGCAFTADATFAAHGGYHAIEIRMARNVKAMRNRCTAGGNCIAMVATDGTLVDANYMTGALNACWDHWEAPTNGVVTASNYCESSLYGALVTGTNTASTSAQQAKGFRIAGTYRMSGSGSAGIWVNGIGTAGSGASNVVIDQPVISWAATGAQQTCVKVSGTTSRVQVNAPICENGFLVTGSDTGGSPSDIQITDPTITGFSPGGGATYPIQIDGGTRVSVRGGRVRVGAGSYTFAIGVAAAAVSTQLINIDAETGSSGILSNAGTGTFSVLPLTGLTLTTGAVPLAKMTASASAPGATGGKLELVCGTNPGTAKLIAYAGTNATPTTILDNIGSGVSGC